MFRLKMRDLALEIVDDPVDLFNHRLRDDFDFDANFDCRYRAALHGKASVSIGFQI
jgi:hypothetical protein